MYIHMCYYFGENSIFEISFWVALLKVHQYDKNNCLVHKRFKNSTILIILSTPLILQSAPA